MHRAIDEWSENFITGKFRQHSLALELARLDELQAAFYQRALDGDVASGHLVNKIIERRCVMLGLHTPVPQVLRIVDAMEQPRQTSTDRIEAALQALADQRKKDDPTTH